MKNRLLYSSHLSFRRNADPVGRLILFKTFPKNELTTISNYITIPALAGPLLGPTIGGMIVSVTSWKWIFLINIPFGVIAGSLALIYLTEIKVANTLKFDFIGFLLIGSGLAGLTFSFQFYGIHYNTSPTIHYITALSLGLLFSYSIYYFYAKHPVCNFKLLRIRSFRVGFLGMLFNRLTTSGIILILTLYLQISLNISPLVSGLVISPLAIAMMLIKFVAPRILKSLGFKKHLFISNSLIGISILSLALITSHTPHFIIALLVFSYGLFISLNFSALSLLSFVDLDTHNMSQGTSLIGIIQGLFSCLGIIGSSLILEEFSNTFPALTESTNIVFQKTFFTLGIITLCCSTIFMLLKNNDGKLVSKSNI